MRMAGITRITGQAYYDAMPGSDLAVGDIWQEMPTFGHLKRSAASALVITPACDLSNRKSETVTYLPIISVRDFLTSRSFSVEMTRVIKAQESVAGISRALDWIAKPSDMPSLDAIQRVIEDATSILDSKCSEKVRTASNRCLAAAGVLKACRAGGSATHDVVRAALGDKEYRRILTDIVRNAYSADVHFLPYDGRHGAVSAMKEHSVALFRYPLSLPVELLQAANDIGMVDWPREISRLSLEHPIAANAPTRPLKTATLKPPYLADLISRFAGLHIRMGSPDFTVETVGEYVQDIEGL